MDAVIQCMVLVVNLPIPEAERLMHYLADNLGDPDGALALVIQEGLSGLGYEYKQRKEP